MLSVSGKKKCSHCKEELGEEGRGEQGEVRARVHSSVPYMSKPPAWFNELANTVASKSTLNIPTNMQRIEILVCYVNRTQ